MGTRTAWYQVVVNGVVLLCVDGVEWGHSDRGTAEQVANVARGVYPDAVVKVVAFPLWRPPVRRLHPTNAGTFSLKYEQDRQYDIESAWLDLEHDMNRAQHDMFRMGDGLDQFARVDRMERRADYLLSLEIRIAHAVQ